MNSSRIKFALALVLIAAAAYGGYRLFIRANMVMPPTIITPKMDVHKALSAALPARISRLLGRAEAEDHQRRPHLIALTFDDGPYPIATPLLLDVLKDLHVKATFFYIGRDAETWPELTRRTTIEGHEIADHTYSHPNLDQLSNSAVAFEIKKDARVMHRYSADPGIDTLFRPPHGRYTEATLEVAQSLHYHTILWSDDPGDWRTVTPEYLQTEIESHATAPDIVLLHSGRMPTVASLPVLVARFRAAGYEFVTVSEMERRVTAEQTNHPSKHPV